jgi:hypothetical protein
MAQPERQDSQDYGNRAFIGLIASSSVAYQANLYGASELLSAGLGSVAFAIIFQALGSLSQNKESENHS